MKLLSNAFKVCGIGNKTDDTRYLSVEEGFAEHSRLQPKQYVLKH